MIPAWLHDISIAGLALGAICATVILADILRHPQHMAIMNVVWPVTALFGSVLTLWLYWNAEDTKMAISVAKGASHCGAGCTLGDICAEWLCFFAPSIAIAFGWHSLFAEKMFAVWVVDFVFAYGFGIAFQYYAIKPMSNISPGRAIWQAIKADTLSLTAWQFGMYGFMAVASFAVFPAPFPTNSVEFWFLVQLAMLCGFATSYPVNWWLLRTGIKEAM